MAVDPSRPLEISGVASFHRREDWQDPNLPVKGPASTLEQVDTFPLHYTAAATMPTGVNPTMVANVLRAMQRDYSTNRNYSLGYGFAVDQAGGVWEIRGFDIKSAANRDWNHRTIPVVCLVSGAGPLSEAARHSVRALYAEAERRTGRKLNIVGHRDIGATSCPGAGIYGQIQLGLITPLPKEEAPMETEYVVLPPKGREGSPWFYIKGAGVRVATRLEAKRVNNGNLPSDRDDSPDAVTRYDLLHESVLRRTP